jgi:uncharacterized protein
MKKIKNQSIFNTILSDESIINLQLTKQLYDNTLYTSIIESRIFKRLKDIHFLGAIDYLYKNKKKHTRYEHTISVALLALKYSELAKLTHHEEQYLVTGALLHDIGHAPLSHSMEPAFKKRFNLSHHSAGLNIIAGTSPLGTEIRDILKNHKIDLNKIVDLLNNSSKERYAYAFSSPINIDTIDGIMRSYTYLTSNNNRNSKLSLKPTIFDILGATFTKNQTILDEFWQLKNQVYAELIHADFHIYADYYSQNFALNENTIQVNDFYLSERKFKNKYKFLFENLENLKAVQQQETISYIKRFYRINYKVDLEDTNCLEEKYTQQKIGDTRILKSNIHQISSIF